MKQENAFNILNTRLFLVITTILLSMCMVLLFADAQETDYNDSKEDAVRLTPNGSTFSDTFSFYGDRDWFKFDAKKDVTYQIFSRPVKVYNPPHYIYIYLYDSKRDDSVYSDMENDGSAFIEWTSASSDLYFFRVQAADPGTYGEKEEYNIQITSIDHQEANTYIRDVPDYSQSEFGRDCRALSAACVLGYWDDHGYGLLVDSKPDRTEDVTRLVNELYGAMMDSFQKNPVKIFNDENMREGIEFFCNIPQYGNNYNFAVNYDPSPDFSLDIIDEIENKRPVLYGVIGHSLWGNHWMVTVGYLKTDTTDWTINHDNWSTTHKDIYIDWDEASESIIKIHPGRKEVLGTSYFDSYPVHQYPIVLPWLEPFGMISSFTEINNLSIPTRSYPLSTGYFTQSNWDRSGDIVWPINPGIYNNQPPMLGNTSLFHFSPSYNNNYIYNIANRHSNTTGYSSIILDPTQGAYRGADLNFYSFMNAPFQGFIVGLFNNPFFSPYQTFSTGLGVSPYNLFSPFQSLSTWPFLFGAPF